MLTPSNQRILNVEIERPPAGNKIFCIQEHGIYILERGPVEWRGMCNTHMGSGTVSIHDGVPDERGFFPDGTEMYKIQEVKDNDGNVIALKATASHNGRTIFSAQPAVMGMWMFNAGLLHGLTLVMQGGTQGVAPCVAITWGEAMVQKRNIVNV